MSVTNYDPDAESAARARAREIEADIERERAEHEAELDAAARAWLSDQRAKIAATDAEHMRRFGGAPLSERQQRQILEGTLLRYLASEAKYAAEYLCDRYPGACAEETRRQCALLARVHELLAEEKP